MYVNALLNLLILVYLIYHQGKRGGKFVVMVFSH